MTCDRASVSRMAQSPNSAPLTNRTFINLSPTGKRQLHGHTKPPGLTLNSQTHVHRLNHVPIASLLPLWAPHARFQYSA